ncbi:MAG: hypothetical protein CL842_08575 [Crocinitomicaceae bacterium]|nr:hypothetical protein [Crocinitomicaceae bacterium]
MEAWILKIMSRVQFRLCRLNANYIEMLIPKFPDSMTVFNCFHTPFVFSLKLLRGIIPLKGSQLC